MGYGLWEEGRGMRDGRDGMLMLMLTLRSIYI